VPVDPVAFKEAVMRHAIGKEKKMTAKRTTNRNFPIPNEGGFSPSGSGECE
jgi:hypothetical protein